jgi:hypothetical protein
VLGRGGVGAGQQQAEVRGRRPGGPHLLPGHQPAAVAFWLGPGDQPRQVGPGAGLAEQLAPGDLAGHRRPDQLPLEFLAAVLDDHGSGEDHADAIRRARDALLGQPGGHHLGDRRRQAPAAPAARPGRARPARIGQQAAPPGQAQLRVPVRRDPRPQLGQHLSGIRTARFRLDPHDPGLPSRARLRVPPPRVPPLIGPRTSAACARRRRVRPRRSPRCAAAGPVRRVRLPWPP